MGMRRMVRVNELLKREIASVLFRGVLGDSNVDPSTVTIIDVNTTSDLRHATVNLSVRGDENEQHQTLHVLRRHRSEIQKQVMANVKLKYTPVLQFELDEAIHRGDRILEILRDMSEHGEISSDE